MTTVEVFTLIMGIVQVLGGIIIVLVIWIVKNIMRDVKTLEEKIENIPKDYVLKNDWKDVVNRIFTKLDEIFNKVDKKADK